MAFNIPSHWKLNQDGSYDVNGDVRIKNTDLVDGKFPVRFGQVGGDFRCDDCTDLTTLEGAPQSVGGEFDCSGCTNLKTLLGAPQSVGNFHCVNCKGLKTLQGAPKSVDGNFNCSYCTGLTSLLGAPKVVRGYFNCMGCLVLKSLQGIEDTKGIKTFYLPPNLKSHVLGLFYTGCTYVKGVEPWVEVVNQYLSIGQKGIAQCSIALVRAGYKALAQL